MVMLVKLLVFILRCVSSIFLKEQWLGYLRGPKLGLHGDTEHMVSAEATVLQWYEKHCNLIHVIALETRKRFCYLIILFANCSLEPLLSVHIFKKQIKYKITKIRTYAQTAAMHSAEMSRWWCPVVNNLNSFSCHTDSGRCFAKDGGVRITWTNVN